jgi:hypothetical protein
MTKLRWNDPPREFDPARAQRGVISYRVGGGAERARSRALWAFLQGELEFIEAQKTLRKLDKANLRELHDEAKHLHGSIRKQIARLRAMVGRSGPQEPQPELLIVEAEHQVLVVATSMKMIRDVFETRWPDAAL